MAMDTNATRTVYDALRTRALTYVPPAGGTLQSRGFLLWSGGYAPDQTPPSGGWGLARLINNVTSDSGLRIAVDYEVMLFARPRKVWAERLEDYADAFDQAFHAVVWRDSTGAKGLAFTKNGRSRDTMPIFSDPVDREIVQIRLVYPVVVWPRYLTALGTVRTAA